MKQRKNIKVHATAYLWLWMMLALNQVHAGDVGVASSANHIRLAQNSLLEATQREALISNKLRLLDNLVNHSAARQRIEHSSDDQAQALLNQARAAHVEATTALGLGKYDEVENYIASGLRKMGMASRMVKDVQRDSALEQRRYEELKSRVLSFKQAFDNIELEKGPVVAGLLQRKQLKVLLEQADEQARAQRYHAANTHLVNAADMVETALLQARDKETLIHRLAFDSPEDEYNYEIQRNKSHVMLVELMLVERNVSSSGREYVKTMTARNAQLRNRAESLAGMSKFEEAKSVMEEATQNLVLALRAVGVAIP